MDPAYNDPYKYQIFNYVKDKENIQIPQIDAITLDDNLILKTLLQIYHIPDGPQKQETQQKLVDIISNKIITEDKLFIEEQEKIDKMPNDPQKDEMQKN